MKVPVGQVVVGAALIGAAVLIVGMVSSADVTSETRGLIYLAVGLVLLTYSIIASILLRRRVREHRQRTFDGF